MMLESYKNIIHNIVTINTQNLKRFLFTFKDNVNTRITSNFIKELKSDDSDLETVDTIVSYFNKEGVFLVDLLVCDYFQNDETKNVKPKKIIRELTLHFAEENFFNQMFLENVSLEENKDSFKIILEFYRANEINFDAIINVLVAHNIKGVIKIEGSEVFTEDLKETEKVTCTLTSKEMNDNLKQVFAFMKKMKIRKYETLDGKEKSFLVNNINSNTVLKEIRKKEALLINKI